MCLTAVKGRRFEAEDDPPEGGRGLAERVGGAMRVLLREGGLEEALNPSSLAVRTGAKLEPALADAEVGERFQLERLGYYCVDPDSAPGSLVLNRTATLRDTWAKVAKGGGPKQGGPPQGKKKNKQKKQKKQDA